VIYLSGIMKKFIYAVILMHGGLSAVSMFGALTELYIDFDRSMHSGFSDETYNVYFNKKRNKNYITVFRQLYMSNNFLTKRNQHPIKEQIPRIIHQIWLGSPFPERFKKYQESLKNMHPGWHYRLWTDDDVKDFNLINQQAFDSATTYSAKANVFRYEILERFGGLYVDTDCECLQSFDILHQYYQFYVGMVTINRYAIVNNAVIGAIPGHPILRTCIENIGKIDYGYGQYGSSGVIYFGHMIIQTLKQHLNADFFSKVLVLPPTYFHSWPGWKLSEHKDPKDYILPSSFAAHYYDSIKYSLHHLYDNNVNEFSIEF
jgi:inositol phosphorylceramide mannosyltransferase catalytic subunit